MNDWNIKWNNGSVYRFWKGKATCDQPLIEDWWRILMDVVLLLATWSALTTALADSILYSSIAPPPVLSSVPVCQCVSVCQCVAQCVSVSVCVCVCVTASVSTSSSSVKEGNNYLKICHLM